MSIVRESGFSVPQRAPLLAMLADPRSRSAIALAGFFSLSISFLIYLLKIYVVGSGIGYPAIARVKADIVVQPSTISSDEHITVSEDIDFTAAPSQFSNSFVRLFDVRRPTLRGSDSELTYQMGYTAIDGVEAIGSPLEQGTNFYRYDVKRSHGSLAEGPHRLGMYYTVLGAITVQDGGRSELVWNIFHPWPGRTGSVSANFILPPAVRKSDPTVSVEIWERDDLVSRDIDVQVKLGEDRMMGDGIPRVMVSLRSTRQLENWEYIRVVLRWPAR